MHESCLEWGTTVISQADVAGKRVLEVGAYDMNGSCRQHVESLQPHSYLGVDMEPGPGVDEVCRAEELVERFGENAFDLVVATELLEHCENWQEVVSNLKRVTKDVLIVTTRSKGFPYHPAPHDCWRYEVSDFREIFSDMEIEVLIPDPGPPGVFIRATKPELFQERDLEGHQLYRQPTE
jgi:hypothetical protein